MGCQGSPADIPVAAQAPAEDSPSAEDSTAGAGEQTRWWEAAEQLVPTSTIRRADARCDLLGRSARSRQNCQALAEAARGAVAGMRAAAVGKQAGETAAV